MNLPNGVVHRPRQATLIAKDGVGIIRIDSKVDGNDGYEIEERTLEDSSESYLKGDWDDFDRLFRLRDPRGTPTVVYSTAIHCSEPRQPNITVVRNLPMYEQRGVARPMTLLGCTVSRFYPPSPSGPSVAKVYEFLSYGLILLDSGRGRVDLGIARAGDKVVVGAGSAACLYNIGDEVNPLITLDFSSHAPMTRGQRDAAEIVSREAGPMLLAYYDDLEVVLTLNTLHINNSNLAGIQVPAGVLDQYGRTIVIPRTSRQDLGSFIYDQFVHNPALIARFADYGINVVHLRSDAVLSASDSRAEPRLFFSRPLASAAKPGTKVYQFFFRDEQLSEPSLPTEPPPPPREPEPPRKIASVPLGRPLIVVVEGAGDWVTLAYRPLFQKKVRAGQRLSVYYADDTSWKSRPEWSHHLDPWEVYLDKDDPDDALRYAQLRPDAVFIVTPDFTHSATARYWLDKTPLVFVEKPFDANVQNVEGLQFSFSRRPRTEVIGLDHYQFYAQPLKRLKPLIDQHVGRALHSVEFVLAEGRPLEVDRVRSLQHGLALDLLPHLIALLTFFGDITSIDEITIPKVWRYEPLDALARQKGKKAPLRKNVELEFQNETGAQVRFTFEDHSGTGYRVPCTAVVGKGFARDAKYMEIRGTEGASLRIDLTTKITDDLRNAHRGYPWGSLFFISESRSNTMHLKTDPYHRHPSLHLLVNDRGDLIAAPLEPRYDSLLTDLLEGTETASAASLSMSQGGHIVKVLDKIWWAIQQSRPWQSHDLLGLDAVDTLQ